MKNKEIRFYEFGGFRLDLANDQLLKGSTKLKITRKSMQVLRFFIENRGKVLTKDFLIENLWEGVHVEEKTLMQHIYIIRKTLKQKEDSEVFIKTVSKTGYCFVAPVKVVGAGEIFTADYPRNPAPNQPADFPNRGRARNTPLAATALSFLLAISLIAAYFFLTWQSSDSKIESIAVLPLTQIGDGDEKLGLGIADNLIAKLGESENLMVTPTSSIIRYLGTEERIGLFELGEQLGVDAVIDGTVQTEGDSVRAILRLYNVKQRRQIWSGAFDERSENIFTLQDQISDEISKELYLNLNGPAKAPKVAKQTENIEAYKAYLDGLYYWNQRSGSKPGSSRSQAVFKKAIDSFERAVDLDPEFALAYAYLSDTYALVHHFRMYRLYPPDESLDKARDAAIKALQLDPESSEAVAAMAFVYNKEGKSRKSRELLSKAIRLKPNNATARKLYAWQLLLVDKVDSAVEQMRLAHKLDPQSATINIALAQILNFARKPQEAIIYAENGLRIAGESVRARLALIESFEQMGEFESALYQVEQILKVNADDSFAKYSKSRLFAKIGKRSGAEKIISELVSRDPHKTFYYSIARTYLALGDREKSFEWIQKKLDEDRTNMFYYNLKHDYDLDSLRGTRRFQELLAAEVAAVRARS